MENVPQARNDILAGGAMMVLAALFAGMALLMPPENWQTAIGTALVTVQCLVAGGIVAGVTPVSSRTKLGRRLLTLTIITAVPAAVLMLQGLRA